MEIWDCLRSPAADAATNMAVDHALLRFATTRGRPLLRLYAWRQPAVSYGYFQKFPAHLVGQYEIVRRPTGGGLVYHGDDTTYTVVIPPDHVLYRLSTNDAYQAIHRAVAAALTDKTELLRQAKAPRGQYECFQNPVAGDVVVGYQKLAGGAQRRGRAGVLHQGSIAGHVDADRLLAGFRSEFGIEFAPYTLTAAEHAETDKLCREKYAPVTGPICRKTGVSNPDTGTGVISRGSEYRPSSLRGRN